MNSYLTTAIPFFVKYRTELENAGFTNIQIPPTHQIAKGMTSAIIHATKPH